MSNVFVLDSNKQPLSPCHPARARQLLDKGKASVYRQYPFTIILKKSVDHPNPQPYRLKIDPGSQVTGFAIVNDITGEVIWAAELQHRGHLIKNSLEHRHQIRRNRRSRKTRYRQPRFNNRTRPNGWLPPSLMSRVHNIDTWVRKIRERCPITDVSVELVRFDTQLMQNAEISGIEYQQGELYGYEIREYLLEKNNRTCAYCKKQNIPLHVEHIIPKKRGGSHRVCNLTMSCKPCNLKKGIQTAEEFGYPEVQAKAKKPLKDAAAINATRWEIYRHLQSTKLPVEIGTGGLTKYNRSQQQLPKTHWLDAACVGESTPQLIINGTIPLQIKAMGHGQRQMCQMDKYGFPRRKKDGTLSAAKCVKRISGFQTGDIVKITRNHQSYLGRIRVRSTGSFTLTTLSKEISARPEKCKLIYQTDGYAYQ